MKFSRRIAESLVLRSVHTEADIEQYIAFNTRYNNPFEGTAGACLLRHHPDTRLQDFWMVEDEATGQIVSTTCLIPWECRLQGIQLKAAQLEMVLTHPDYRGKGLVRAQIERFHQEVSQRQFDLSIIWGIHYFYRQFGYAYALDGGTAESLPIWRIPEPVWQDQAACQLRPAAVEDTAYLREQYAHSMRKLDLTVSRPERFWRYLLEYAQHPIEIIETGQPSQPSGYLTIQRSARKTRILESSLADAGTALLLLQALRQEGQQAQRQEISISSLDRSPLVQAARALGSQKQPGGQWLLRLTDLRRLLEKMGPLFTARLQAAGWGGFTGSLSLNLYRRAYALEFDASRLDAVRDLNFVDASMGADGGDVCIPPEAFTRLLFGYRSLEALTDAWPDISIKPAARPLIEVLFPRLAAYLYTPYHYLGQIEQAD